MLKNKNYEAASHYAVLFISLVLPPSLVQIFSSAPLFSTGSGAHPVTCPMGTGGSFPEGKARPGGDADHSPPSSAEVKKE
jgi:hypothetical protein